MSQRLDEACPIWGTVATVESGSFDGWSVNSARTDGRYRIARSAIEQVRTLPVDMKAKLTTWLVDERRGGVPAPMITTYTVEQVACRPRLKHRDRIQRFMLFLRTNSFDVGDTLHGYTLDDTPSDLDDRIAAWIELTGTNRVRSFLLGLVDEEMLLERGTGYQLSFQGFSYLDELEQSNVDSDQAFVAMWFSPEMDDAYRIGIEPAVIEAGYRPVRIDQKEHANKIDDEIVSEIRRSRFVIADFTCGFAESSAGQVAIARGGVYYEAGFAQGLGIPVIWAARADCISHVHFDTRQYAHIVWNTPEELRTALLNRIGALIGRRL